MEFDLKAFRRRIWQELRRVKMVNWMEYKRTEKRRKEAEAREKKQQEEGCIDAEDSDMHNS